MRELQPMPETTAISCGGRCSSASALVTEPSTE
jgi:hypothetical protein